MADTTPSAPISSDDVAQAKNLLGLIGKGLFNGIAAQEVIVSSSALSWFVERLIPYLDQTSAANTVAPATPAPVPAASFEVVSPEDKGVVLVATPESPKKV